MSMGYDSLMKRQALAAALLALLAGPPSPMLRRPSAHFDAGLGGTKAIFTCGTDQEPARRTEGRVSTWNFSALSFTPDFRGMKPLLIPYKSITRLEFGPTPGHRAETVITPPCSLNRQDRYLTIFYKVSADVAGVKEKQDQPESRESREKERQDRQDKRDRKYRMDRKDQRDQAAQEQKKENDKEKEHIAVFEFGEGVLRPTLRIVETRSGKRITYQDAAARKAAR
jgi:hypothetical protein